MHEGTPATGERAVVTFLSLRALVDQHLQRDRAELLAELARPERVEVTIRPVV